MGLPPARGVLSAPGSLQAQWLSDTLFKTAQMLVPETFVDYSRPKVNTSFESLVDGRQRSVGSLKLFLIIGHTESIFEKRLETQPAAKYPFPFDLEDDRVSFCMEFEHHVKSKEKSTCVFFN